MATAARRARKKENHRKTEKYLERQRLMREAADEAEKAAQVNEIEQMEVDDFLGAPLPVTSRKSGKAAKTKDILNAYSL